MSEPAKEETTMSSSPISLSAATAHWILARVVEWSYLDSKQKSATSSLSDEHQSAWEKLKVVLVKQIAEFTIELQKWQNELNILHGKGLAVTLYDFVKQNNRITDQDIKEWLRGFWASIKMMLQALQGDSS
ncbi:hypothetical protein GLAREA_04759 [Glarea lozoyensis ATCC 20868]|uniref:Uncharacterized protein n=1 Tax=Glarea lozoyensis (strain ATCC 20868 / MF5171) TaxID=1116229 RepID=S3DNA9_GLAL2|nr:uncharacterized protein GLAREA_04759 [Glarea lozoyensis ATCC 20868]EPE27968.1 hypothetical protein GLAREA_04759 [Glarea lozoyensis ATCC 20868]